MSSYNMDLSRYGAQFPIPTCDLHQEDELDIYCHTCKKSICLECTKKDHANHEYEKSYKVAIQFRREIPTVVSEKTQEILSKHRQGLKVLSQFKRLTRNKVDHTINRMNSHRATIHAMVDSITEEMIQICQEKGNIREQEIDTCITTHRKTIQEMEELFTFMQKSSSSLTDYSLVQLKIDFEHKLDQASEIKPSQHEKDSFYVEGRIKEDNLKAMVGSFIPNNPTKVEVNERTSFTVGDMRISTVVPVLPDSAWVHKYNSTKVELVDMHGSVKDTRELNHLYYSFDIDGDNDIYYSSTDDKIQKVDKNGTITTVRNTSPLIPVGVSLTKEGDLLVTLAEKWDYEPKDDSRRIVQRIKTSGEVVTTYEFNADRTTRLFTYPHRARQNNNGDICVVDITGRYTGRLCVLGIDGVLKFIYKAKNLKNKFLPDDVVCDCTSNIIVNDKNNHSIHLLSPTGGFVKYLTEDVTEFTIALGLYQSALWVGCSKGVIKVFHYLTKGTTKPTQGHGLLLYHSKVVCHII